jgi:alkanesulfonate monooxygenase SsuD/methylene tetrahydromethanopterin reductase-like flavin-dependent oxidoreductase (luciferase family)
MKFGLMYANVGPFASPEMATHLAQTAERCGVESLWTVEHSVVPVGYKSTYPYDPSAGCRRRSRCRCPIRSRGSRTSPR